MQKAVIVIASQPVFVSILSSDESFQRLMSTP